MGTYKTPDLVSFYSREEIIIKENSSVSCSHLLSHESRGGKKKQKTKQKKTQKTREFGSKDGLWIEVIDCGGPPPWKLQSSKAEMSLRNASPRPSAVPGTSPVVSEGLLNGTKVCVQQFSLTKNAESGKSSVLVAGTQGLIIELGRACAASMLTNNIAMTYLASKAKIRKSLCELQHTVL